MRGSKRVGRNCIFVAEDLGTKRWNDKKIYPPFRTFHSEYPMLFDGRNVLDGGGQR